MAVSKRKGIWGWMFFDWANQPFHTLIITFIFAPYFTNFVAGSPEEGQAMWGFALGVGGLIIAFSAPILGAIADATGPRRPWILFFSVLYVIGMFGLWIAVPGADNLTLILFLFVIGLIGAEYGLVFVSSLLPLLGTKDELGRISGSAWAMGYWGGLVSLIIVLTLMVPSPGSENTLIGLAPIFGLDASLGEGARATGPMSAIWYLIFMIPFFLWAPDAARGKTVKGAVSKGLSELTRTIKSLPQQSSLFAYLGSSMFYRDALNGLYAFGGIYAAGVLGWGTFQLGVFGIIAAFAGAIGAWLGGKADARFGPKPIIIVAILALIGVSTLTVSTGPNEVLFIAVGTAAEPSGLPTLIFYLCGSIIGAAGGTLQAASRTMLVRQADPLKMTETFGLYALAGRATSFLAPFLIAYVTLATESQRIGVTPVIALFLIGLVMLIWVKADGRE